MWGRDDHDRLEICTSKRHEGLKKRGPGGMRAQGARAEGARA